MFLSLKTESFAKIFFLVSLTGLLIYVLLALYTFHTAFSTMFRLKEYQEYVQGIPNPEKRLKQKYGDFKYILLWVSDNSYLNTIDEGQDPFIDHNCTHTNCYITKNKYFLNDDYKNFDALIFDAKDLFYWRNMTFPETRLYHQKYIFFSSASSDDVPICNIDANHYFNWTWTYKLNSDIVSTFLEVKDLDGHVVAPAPFVEWFSDGLKDFTEEEIDPLEKKKPISAVAWITKKCETRNDRFQYAKRLRAVLKEHSLALDIYGCGYLKCAKQRCSELFVKDYYFYFAAEESNAEDYVTDEVLIAYDNYAIPVVFGGANYNKFLPKGSYLNTANNSIDKLAAVMDYIIQNPKIHYNFHRWRKHYVISRAEKFKGICKLCEYLNDAKFDSVSVKEDFREWWYTSDTPLFRRCIPRRDAV